MNRGTLSLLLFLILYGMSHTLAQLSSYDSNQALYEEALELYQKGIYQAAQARIQTFIQAEKASRGQRQNDVIANARFIEAVCAYQLKQAQAEVLLLNFKKDFPENSKAPLGAYYLGKYFFDQGQYAKALPSLVSAYGSGTLNKDRIDEVIFLMGYSYFVETEEKTTDNDKAERYLGLASATPNPYQIDASYYYAILLYRQGNYAQAYNAMKALEDDAKYKNEIPVYMANTLYKTQRYGELFTLSNRLKPGNNSASRQKYAPVYAIAANASYEQEDYVRTSEYFRKFEENRGSLTRSNFFRYGYAYYQQGQYAEAIPIFQRVLSRNDSLGQVASYYLGFCYLKTDDPKSARFAFYKASESTAVNLDRDIIQESLYQYAKISFATQFYEEALEALELLTDPIQFPNFTQRNEAKILIGEILFYSKDYPESISYFESTTLNTDRAKEAYQTASYYYGLELHGRSEYRKAVPFFRKALKTQTRSDLDLASQYWIGESLFRAGDFKAAVSAYEQFLQMTNANRHKYFPYAHYGIAWGSFKEKDYRKALKNFDAFTKIAGNKAPKRLRVDAQLRSGDCLFLLRDYPQANQYYQRVVNMKYTYEDYAYYQMAEGLYRQDQYTQSVRTFVKVIDNYQDSELRDNALDRASEINATWLKNYERAAYFAGILIETYPKSPLAADAYNRLALAAYNSGDESSAIRYFSVVLTDYAFDQRNSQIALDNLSGLLSPREFDKVLKDYRKRAPKLDNNLAELTFNTGVDRFFGGNYESAIDLFSTYLKDFKNGPNFYEALLYRARSFKAIDEFPKANADYKRVYDTPVRNDFTNQALLEAAELALDQQDFSLSLELYQTLNQNAQSLANRVQAKFGMGNVYMSMGKPSLAKQSLEAITGDPEVAEFSRTKARVLIGEAEYAMDDLEGALRTFTEVEAEFNDEFAARSQYWITQILYDKSDYQGAYDAGVYLKNNYPSFNFWKAKAFLIVAEANYAMGELFQAKGVLESLIAEERFPEIQEAAQKRLDEIEQEERINQGFNGNN